MDNLITTAKSILKVDDYGLAELIGSHRSTIQRWEKRGKVTKFAKRVIEDLIAERKQ